jgi:type I restriction enzyme, S subunit
VASSAIASLPQRVALGDVTRWMSGGTPSRSIARYWNGTIPWISATTLKTSEISTSDQRVTAEAVVAGSKLAPLDSTLLLVRGSALHKEIRAGLVVGTVCFNQDVKALIPVSGLAPKFLTYSLLGRSHELLKLVSSAGNSAGVLDTKLVQAFEIWLPSAEEQQAIVGALSDADELVVSLERLIAKKRDIREGAMQQLLTGRTRLPGFDGVWREESLNDLFQFKNGLNKAKVFFGRGTPIVNYLDVLQNIGLFASKVQGLVTVSQAEAKSYSARVDDVFFTRTSETVSEIGLSSVLLDPISDAVFSGFILRARPTGDVLDNHFKKYCFHSRSVREQIIATATYTTRALTNGRSLSRVRLRIPPRDEQRAIAAVLSDMDAEIDALRERLTKTKDIRQGMMQELLTGRTRLVPQEVRV